MTDSDSMTLARQNWPSKSSFFNFMKRLLASYYKNATIIKSFFWKFYIILLQILYGTTPGHHGENGNGLIENEKSKFESSQNINILIAEKTFVKKEFSECNP